MKLVKKRAPRARSCASISHAGAKPSATGVRRKTAGLAGCISEDGWAELLTFTVITTDPNEVVQPLHDRMPVIIPEHNYDRWLNRMPNVLQLTSRGLTMRTR